uniref:Uncharacterized protein n=1 Tax=Anguilla anguilla TaxID=7936 RepID=A0A0E9VID8_ANGAN
MPLADRANNGSPRSATATSSMISVICPGAIVQRVPWCAVSERLVLDVVAHHLVFRTPPLHRHFGDCTLVLIRVPAGEFQLSSLGLSAPSLRCRHHT